MRSVSALSFAAACVLVAGATSAQPTPDAPPDPGAPPADAPGAKPGDDKKPGDAKPPDATVAPPSGEAPVPGAAPADPAPPVTEPPPETPPPPPATPPPPSPPPAVTAAPVSGPYFQPTAAAGGEAGASEPKAQPPPESTLAIEFDGGLHRRMGDSSDYGFEKREAGGIVFGPALWLSPARLWSAGLSYRRIALGIDRSGPGDDSLTVRRRLDAVWLGGRAYPWRTDSVGLFVLLELGMSWQHADADGTRMTAEFLRPAESYTCAAGAGPGFALGGGAGLDVDIERDLSFIVQVDATAHRHTSETIGSCAPGSGSVTNIGANIGFAYKIDLAPEGASGASPPAKRFKRGSSEPPQ